MLDHAPPSPTTIDQSSDSQRPPTIPEDLWSTLPPKARALVEDIVRKSADGKLREADLALLSSTADRLSGDK